MEAYSQRRGVYKKSETAVWLKGWPNNVTRIDKEAKHWIASFYNTDKKAFISRSYMKNALNITTKKKKNL